MTDKAILQQALRALTNLINSSCIADPQPWRDARQDAFQSITALETAISQPVTDLDRYITANYPDARGKTITARVIDALETMDIALGMREIAQPVKAALKDQEINALWADALKYGDPTAGNAHIRFARALLAQSQQSAAIAQPVPGAPA